jgi:drug/metabolite transporter (DMT)-like permease
MLIYIKLLFTMVFWGGTFIAGRLISETVPPFSAAFLRFFIASVFLCLMIRKREGGLPPLARSVFFRVVLLAVTGVFLYNYFFFKGLQTIEAGRASLIIANNPVFIALFSAWIFRERLKPLQALGAFLSVVGAFVVITRGNPLDLWNGGPGAGDFYILCCVASWVTFSLIGKTVMNDLTPLGSITYAAVFGAFGLFLPAVAEGMLPHLAHYRWLDWMSLFYLGVFGTVLGFVWYYEGIRRIGPTRAGLFINFVPVNAVVMGFLILGEPVTVSLLMGGALVVTGVYLTNRRSARGVVIRPANH